MIFCVCSSVNSTYPSQREEMLVFSKVHSYRFAMFSSCKRVIALQAQKDLIGKVETFSLDMAELRDIAQGRR